MKPPAVVIIAVAVIAAVECHLVCRRSVALEQGVIIGLTLSHTHTCTSTLLHSLDLPLSIYLSILILSPLLVLPSGIAHALGSTVSRIAVLRS